MLFRARSSASTIPSSRASPIPPVSRGSEPSARPTSSVLPRVMRASASLRRSPAARARSRTSRAARRASDTVGSYLWPARA